MDNLDIDLIYNPDHFRELYYKNGEGSVMTANQTKNPIRIALFFIVVTVTLYILSFRFPGISWMIFLAGIITFVSVIASVFSINKYVRWKNNIEGFVRKIDEYKLYKISLTSKSLETQFDSDITIETWDKIKKIQIGEDHVLLINDKDICYIFPAKSMGSVEFNRLKEFIKNKVK